MLFIQIVTLGINSRITVSYDHVSEYMQYTFGDDDLATFENYQLDRLRGDFLAKTQKNLHLFQFLLYSI